MYFVYIVQCSDGTYYIGSTNDLNKRLHRHNFSKSGAHYTKIRRPVTLKYMEEYQTVSEALKREAALKKLTRKQKEALLLSKNAMISHESEESKNKMQWLELEQEIKLLSQKITEKPDILIGIVRGGLVPARLLSSLLHVKKMHCLSVEKMNDERKVVTEITEDLHGKHIVLIEDILETGKSLNVAKVYLESKGAIIKTACLYTLPTTQFKPDYFLRKIPEVIQFPWETV